MSSLENRRSLPLLPIVTSLAALTLSYGAAAAAESSGGCRCMLTFSSGATRETYCDGFDTSTHGRCACETQTRANGAVACVPKASRSDDSVAADRHERRSHRSR